MESFLQGNMKVKRYQITKEIMVIVKCLLATWTLSEDSLSLILTGYSMQVPVLKYLFTAIEAIDSWGMEPFFVALGFGTIFYLVKDRQKSPWVSGLSAFFAICTVVGISYEKTSTWDCIFLFKTQFLFAVLVAIGYYCIYKNLILFIGLLFERNNSWLRRETKGRIEEILFDKHPFLGPLIFILICGLPWLINFFPGTMQYDAQVQVFMNFGVIDKTGHFPIIMTEIMSGCICIGKEVFGSDNFGMFLYTMSQFLFQSLVFSYAVYVMRREKTPVIICWGALFFWMIYPFFPIWGYTMGKDSLHYICLLLIIITLQDIILSSKEKMDWWQSALILLGITGITISRNDGRYTVILTLLCWTICYRRYWKAFVLSMFISLLTVFMIDGVYMHVNHIPAGSKAEMLSVPLQQTARYLNEHMHEVTKEEAQILQSYFDVPLEKVAEEYDPIISDPIKGKFLAGNNLSQLRDYFKVWFCQFLKHPDTYIQAFINHTYGYFYPNMTDPQGVIAFFGISRGAQWQDKYVDLYFAISNATGRDILQSYFSVLSKSPIFSMFMSPGFHSYLLIGAGVCLLSKKKRKELFLLIPEICVLLISIVSPVNAYVRYFLPIMAAAPINLAWCYLVSKEKEST